MLDESRMCCSMDSTCMTVMARRGKVPMMVGTVAVFSASGHTDWKRSRNSLDLLLLSTRCLSAARTSESAPALTGRRGLLHLQRDVWQCLVFARVSVTGEKPYHTGCFSLPKRSSPSEQRGSCQVRARYSRTAACQGSWRIRSRTLARHVDDACSLEDCLAKQPRHGVAVLYDTIS